MHLLKQRLVEVEASRIFEHPDVRHAVDALQKRRADQLATADQFTVFTGFRFTDEIVSSKIKFRNRVLPTWCTPPPTPAIHYDHGSGIAVADVDSDGLADVYFTTQVGSNGLWRNLGDGTFEDVTEAAGVAVHGKLSAGVAFAGGRL